MDYDTHILLLPFPTALHFSLPLKLTTATAMLRQSLPAVLPINVARSLVPPCLCNSSLYPYYCYYCCTAVLPHRTTLPIRVQSSLLESLSAKSTQQPHPVAHYCKGLNCMARCLHVANDATVVRGQEDPHARLLACASKEMPS